MKNKLSWSESHGTAAYIPCGNAYCAEGNCANCETQMQLQVEQKTSQGLRFEDLTEAEQDYLKQNPLQ